MALEQYAYIAEIVGVIVIAVTLIYLAIQTKQNTAAVRASVRHAVLEADRESIQMFIEYPSLNKLTNLTAEEETRLVGYFLHFTLTREHHWQQYRDGVLDETSWTLYRGAFLHVMFSSRLGRAFSDSQVGSALRDPDFVRHINEWLSKIDLPDADYMVPRIQVSD